MLYLLWGLLNIGLFLFFILICFKATKLIIEKLGLFASLVFVFGLLSFIGYSNNENNEPNTNKIKTWKFVSEDSLKNNQSDILKYDLKKTLVSKYDLGIKYGIDRQRKNNIPISAYSTTTGFISGTNWNPIDITAKNV